MDISAFRERRTSEAFTVSELNELIKGMFDSNRLLSNITVRGEISNFKAHSSGHLYFSLKDAGGQVRAVMFQSAARGLRWRPDNGARVIATGSVSVYPRDGSYQLYVSSMQPDGVGALYLAYEQLKARLDAEGLFSPVYKKPIPSYPARIGVVTSPTGAAVRDIINVITRRFPSAEILLYPALVQGEGAEESVIRGIEFFNSSASADVLIIGRGGGSIEDLWAFNGERLARCIFASEIPIISAVGHETDFTIADFVADLRAPTPSAAAELAVPDVRELLMRIASLADRCERSLHRTVDGKRERLNALSRAGIFKDPMLLVAPHKEMLAELSEELLRSFSHYAERKRAAFAERVARLEALSPLSVLSRGYSVATKDGKCLTEVEDIRIGDRVGVRLKSGAFIAEVVEVDGGR